jgi:hypothetical protein
MPPDPDEFDAEEWLKQSQDAKPESDAKPKGNGDGADSAVGGPAVPDFPVLEEAAFHGPIGDIVRTIEPHTESDPTLLLVGGLTYFGNALGRGPHIIIEGTPHYSNFNVVFVGETAKSRKGTGDGRLRQVFNIAEPGWCGYRIKDGLSSGEGLINEVRDAVIKINKKGEEVVVDEGVEDERLLVMQPEFGGVLAVMGREGSILSAVLRNAWDGRDLAVLVKQRPQRATNPHISVIGHITKSELTHMLDQTSMVNGLANRFLSCCVRRSKLLPFGGALEIGEVTRLGVEVGQALERARGIGAVTWSRGTENKPRGGAEGWMLTYPILTEAKPGLVGAMSARDDAQVVRLAQLYALWDGSALIEPEHLTAAIAVWKYSHASVRYIFGQKTGNRVADTILGALKNAYPEGLTRTEIYKLFSNNQEASSIASALQELREFGVATMSRSMSGGRGRPTEQWTYHP